MFFSNACWPQLLAPLEIIVSKISLKMNYSHSYNFVLLLQGYYEHEIVQPWQDYNYEEHNARWGGEFEWPKTLQGPQLENWELGQKA